MDKGVVHTGDLIFPWQKGIRQDAEADSQQKTRNFEISGGQSLAEIGIFGDGVEEGVLAEGFHEGYGVVDLV